MRHGLWIYFLPSAIIHIAINSRKPVYQLTGFYPRMLLLTTESLWIY